MKLIGLLLQEDAQATMVFSGMAGQGVSTTTSKPARATEILKLVDKKAKEADVELGDLVMVFKDSAGKPVVKEMKDITPGKGAKRGSFWGLLVGLVLGGPIGGLLGGMALGAIYGKAVDHGLDDEFVKTLSEGLNLGQSAVLALVKPEDYERSVAYLKTFDGDLIEADMSDETEAALSEVSQKEEVQQALKD